tara:strand:- start:560 stop:760 length:201 start_codon:yes stop_codon:yes gene_type:complete
MTSMLSKFTAIGGLSGNDAARNQNDMQGLAALSSSTPHRPARKSPSHPHRITLDPRTGTSSARPRP